MQGLLYYLTFLAVGAVGVVLAVGILNLARSPSVEGRTADGKPATNLSQQLMRWRVILQFAAIVILMLVLYLSR